MSPILLSAITAYDSPVLAFVSYARHDLQKVKPVVRGLRAAGFEVWLDVDAVEPGEEFPKAIAEAIKQADVFVLFLSPASIVRPWVLDEVGYARRSRLKIIPVEVEPVALSPELELQIGKIQRVPLDEVLPKITGAPPSRTTRKTTGLRSKWPSIKTSTAIRILVVGSVTLTVAGFFLLNHYRWYKLKPAYLDVGAQARALLHRADELAGKYRSLHVSKAWREQAAHESVTEAGKIYTARFIKLEDDVSALRARLPESHPRACADKALHALVCRSIKPFHEKLNYDFGNGLPFKPELFSGYCTTIDPAFTSKPDCEEVETLTIPLRINCLEQTEKALEHTPFRGHGLEREEFKKDWNQVILLLGKAIEQLDRRVNDLQIAISDYHADLDC